MKIKFAIVYVLAGVAFLVVSLWLFLSGGKSAKASRFKYRLGGIMLTAWSMLTAVSCIGGPPQVTCYEPEPPEVMCYDPVVEEDMVSIIIKDYGGSRLKPGDALLITIVNPSTDRYRMRIHAGDVNAPVLQECNFQAPEEPAGVLEFQAVLAPTDYRGDAFVEFIAVFGSAGGQESESVKGTLTVTIVG